MQNRTKIFLAGSIAAITLATAVGVSQASDKHRYGHGFGHKGQERHQMMAGIMDRMDTNRDGSISRAELDSMRKSEISKHDANGDGNLSLEEFEGLWLSFVRDRMVDGFQKLDRDGDAVITEEEIARPLDRMMSWLDRNDDDKLSKKEMRHKGHRWGGHRDNDDDDD